MSKKRSETGTQIQSALNNVRADEKRRRREDYLTEHGRGSGASANAFRGNKARPTPSSGLLDALPDSSEIDVPLDTERQSTSANPRGRGAVPASTGGMSTGGFDATAGEWVWDLKSDMRLRVTKFKGNTYVDIRKTWNGNPTQKGVCIPIELFRTLQVWGGLDDAVKAVETKK
eukprot:Lankesteria_metandrocarpae@DN2153_c0_g1_i1.p1